MNVETRMKGMPSHQGCHSSLLKPAWPGSFQEPERRTNFAVDYGLEAGSQDKAGRTILSKAFEYN